MSVKLPNGATVFVASEYGDVIDMASLTNAAQAVADLGAGHGILAGAVLEVTSGWSRLNARIARAFAVAADDVTLEKINTVDLERYPAAGGAGSVREITGWTQIVQITGFEPAGGDQQFATYSFLEADDENQIPTVKSASSINITTADDPLLPHHAALVEADDDKTPRALKVQLKGGGVIYYNGYISFNQTPTMGKNSIMEVKSSIAFVAPLNRYPT